MRPTIIEFTPHARRRLSQRNLSEADIALVCLLGQYEYRAGAVCYFLGRRQLITLNNSKALARLVGVTVLCCPYCQCVLTAYHNQHGLKDHRHKTKYDRVQRPCPYCLASRRM
jgi:hypothetical protein